MFYDLCVTNVFACNANQRNNSNRTTGMGTSMEQQNALTVENLLQYTTKQRTAAIQYVEITDSTNRVLKELAKNGAKEGQVVLANEQTSGRGRLGRSFFSPKDRGIYMSVLLRPDDKAYEVAPMTAWVAVAVANAIESVAGVRPGVKWVNDLILNGKKVCGIMTELAVKEDSNKVDYVIVGIGLNVSGQSEEFPDEIKMMASSIEAETGIAVSRAQLAAEIIREIDLLNENWQIETAKYLDQYRKDCITVGKEVRVISPEGERAATALSVESDFSLLVRYDVGTIERVYSGEVSVRGLYGYT